MTSYHVHSLFSDGKAEIAEYIRVAGEIGLDELGFSDHYVLAPGGKEVAWSMQPDEVDAYVEAVQTAAGEACGMIIRLGIEMDYFPETTRELTEVLEAHPFDYAIGAVHFFDGFPIDERAENWETLSQSERDDIIRGYWIRMKEMAETGLFDIAAHLDLPKKFGFQASIDLSAEITAAVDAVARSGMAIEINTSGWYAPCAEAYPSFFLIKECKRRDIPLLVTSDAHMPVNLIRDFDRAYRLAREAGYSEMADFAGRQRYVHPL